MFIITYHFSSPHSENVYDSILAHMQFEVIYSLLQYLVHSRPVFTSIFVKKNIFVCLVFVGGILRCFDLILMNG